MINYENSTDPVARPDKAPDDKKILNLEETVRFQQNKIDQLEQDLRKLKNELRSAVNAFNLLAKKL